MKQKLSRPASARSVIETLESRTLLSGAAAAFDTGGATEHSAVVVAAKVKNAATKTALVVVAGTLGQPITFTVTVRAAAAAGSPTGTVNINDHGHVIEIITLAPTTSTNPKYAYSLGSATLTQPPGGSAYFFGNHAVGAAYIPTGAFSKSSVGKTFNVPKPAYTTLSDGVKTAVIAAGSGPAIQVGQTAAVLYTGYLEKNGHIFDDSINDGGTPYTFPVATPDNMIITGFNDGTLGLQVGETQLVLIPPAEGYGAAGSPPAIPRNATLLFVITLESIS